MTTDTEALHIPDALYDEIDAQARRTYTRHRSSIRGQQVTRADSFDTHLISHAYQAGHAAAKAETAAAVAQERERCIGIIESHHIPVGNSAAGEMACEWTYDALETIRDAIRAGAKEPGDEA